MKILVTGGTGFTGKALVRRLLDDGHQVVALDYKEGVKTQELHEWGAEVVIGSVTDKAVVKRCMKDVEIVHHVAAAFRELNVPDSFYYDVNVNGTRWVMEAAMEQKVRKVVYCSTQGVHGHISNPPGNENSPIAPEDYYQKTKYEGEEVVQEYIKKGMKCTILRPTAIYGPGDPERFFMIFKKVKKGIFPMFGSGETTYHPVYIDNLVDAFVLAMQEDVGNGGTYLIGDSGFVTIKTLVKMVAGAMGVSVKVPHLPIMPLVIAGHVCEKVCKPFGISPPIFPRRVDWYRQYRGFDISKAKQELGYDPKVDLKEGLARTAQWYRQEGYLQ